MDRQAKSAIKALVLELRHTLEDDIAIQLKRYGYAGGRWIEADKLPHLWTDDAAMAERQRIDAALAQALRRIGVDDPAQATAVQREEAVGWFVREIAYTHLNRLAALKALEVRGLIPEVITARDSYGGRSRAHYDLRNAQPELCRGADEGLAETIRQSCRQVYREFRLLFDVGDPAEGRSAPVNTLVWPGHTALKACIAAVNGLDERAENSGPSLWLEDEIIGWLYQFYNAEEKEAIRKRGKPRRPAEVAVINQFFTPRWIVKFLVDNTLGRLGAAGGAMAYPVAQGRWLALAFSRESGDSRRVRGEKKSLGALAKPEAMTGAGTAATAPDTITIRRPTPVCQVSAIATRCTIAPERAGNRKLTMALLELSMVTATVVVMSVEAAAKRPGHRETVVRTVRRLSRQADPRHDDSRAICNCLKRLRG